MQLARRFRPPALLCAFAVLLCELISRPYAQMGISDEGPYILTVQKLVATGHLTYNGWVEPMLGWQLYLGAALVKVFGFSFTTVRLSTLLVAMALAFILQRVMVRANLSERNATIGTLALVLSPLYLLLSATFMSDIHGLFAIVLCLYGCLRALQASTSRATIGWLCFAVATNDICGTSRQIAWLGVLVIVPSTLWLLRARRRIFLAGAAATVAGAFFIVVCMLWFARQPYTVHAPLFADIAPVNMILRRLVDFFVDLPFLLLPVAALFFAEIRKSRKRTIAILVVAALAYAGLALYGKHVLWLEPTQGDWLTAYGGYGYVAQGLAPVFLHTFMRVLLTVISLGGVIGLVLSFFRSNDTPVALNPSNPVSWRQLGWLFAPFSVVYILILATRAVTVGIADRYALELMIVAVICLVRYYQDRIRFQLPLVSVLLIAIMAAYGIAITHNTFALYRARVVLASEMHAAGIPETAVDGGWENNLDVELQHSNHINFPTITIPAHAYTPTPEPSPIDCHAFWYDYTPHIHPLYGVSFDPNACYGPAPFAPVHYSRWLSSTQGALYVVRYTPTPEP